jgi:hypothetical protein
MRGFLGRIARNAGAALTAGGTVLGLGLGFGAIGLAETRSHVSPLENAWVMAGLLIAIAGTVWCVGVFVVAMIATAKSERFTDQIGKAFLQGELMLRHPPLTDEAIDTWGAQISDLIEAGLGSHEAYLFFTTHDLGIKLRRAGTDDSVAWMGRRMQALARLMSRLHTMEVAFSFDGRREWISESQSSSPMISSKDQT